MQKSLPKPQSTVSEFFAYIGGTNFLEERKTRYHELVAKYPFFREFLIDIFNPDKTYSQVLDQITDEDLARLRCSEFITFQYYWTKDRHRYADENSTEPKKKYSKFLNMIDAMHRDDVDFIIAGMRGEVHDVKNNKVNALFLQAVDPEIFLGNVQG